MHGAREYHGNALPAQAVQLAEQGMEALRASIPDADYFYSKHPVTPGGRRRVEGITVPVSFGRTRAKPGDWIVRAGDATFLMGDELFRLVFTAAEA